MAKQITSKKKKNKELEKAEVAMPGKRDGIYLLCGLASLAIAFYTFVSLLSYLFTWADDQSLFADDGVLSTVMHVENGGGKIGLVWANFLISKLFGLGAFIIPFFFGGVALFCLKIKKIRLLRLFFVSLFGCVMVSVAFSFIFSFTKFDSWFGNGAGGSYGYYVNEWLKSMLGNTGAASVIFIAIAAWAIAVNNKIVDRFNRWIDRITAPSEKKSKLESMVANEEAEDDVIDINEVLNENGNVEPADSGKDFGFEVKDQESDDEDDGIIDLTGIGDDGAAGDDGLNENLNLEIVSAPAAPVVNDLIKDDIEKVQDGNEFLSELSEDELSTLFDPRLDLSSYQAPSQYHL